MVECTERERSQPESSETASIFSIRTEENKADASLLLESDAADKDEEDEEEEEEELSTDERTVLTSSRMKL